MLQITFVVLHYKVYDITEQCVDLLLKQNYQNYRIIVVDNCSANDSCERLRTHYANNDKVEVVELERNYGFAKGNDVGYMIAKYKYQADSIVVMNNDVLIDDAEFCSVLSHLRIDENIGVIGPDIVNKIGEHQNPAKNCIVSIKQLNRAIRKTRIKLILLPLLYNLKKRTVNPPIDKSYSSKPITNIPLHGACLIFTKSFIETFNYAFYPDTFLYGEEEILYFITNKHAYKTMYIPELVVNHMEDVSTESIHRKKKEKRLFELRHSLKSLKIFKQLFLE